MLRHVDRRRFLCILAAFSCLGFATTALGQEVSKMWTTGGLGSAPYLTERQAQQAIEEDIGTDFEVDEPFKWHVADVKMTSQQVTYYYRMRPVDLIKSEWKHRFINVDYDSEEQMLQSMRNLYASEGNCPAVQITPGPWRVTSTGPDGSESMLAATHHVLQYFIANGNCVGYSRTPNVYQVREVRCPNPGMMSWRQEIQACDVAPWHSGMVNSVMTYTTTPITNQCHVGNPCEPTTGNKSQPEQDINFAWINFTRYFQSMTSTPRGGFGPNWTHSHNLRLAIDQVGMGLIEADGTHLAFHPVDVGFEAIDGSGDRLVQIGDEWNLRRSAEVLVFSSNGQLRSRVSEDGATWTYQYDPRGRLLSIRHHTGRELTFHYDEELDHDLISAITVGETQLKVIGYRYDTDGRLVDATNDLGRTRTYHHEDPRYPYYLTGVTAEGGVRYSWFAYDEKGRVVCSRHSADCGQPDIGVEGVRLAYAADGSVLVTGALGDERVYGITPESAGGYPRKVTTLGDEVGEDVRTYWSAESDFRRRLMSYRDRNGGLTRISYVPGSDPSTGRPASIKMLIEASGTSDQRVTEIYTDEGSNRTVLRREGRLETRIVRNARFQPISISRIDLDTGATRVTTYSYCEIADITPAGECAVVGLVKQIDGPRTDVADVLKFRYYTASDVCGSDPGGYCRFRAGDLKSVTNALGHVLNVESYDQAARPVLIKNINESVTLQSHDLQGNFLLSSRNGFGAWWRYQYGVNGLVEYSFDPDLVRHQYSYDSARRMTIQGVNGGGWVRYALDDAGNRVNVDVPQYFALGAKFDRLGRRIAVEDADGVSTKFEYDAAGNVTRVVNALQQVARHDYDVLGRRVRTVEDVGGVNSETSVKYNESDEVVSIIDPNGLTTSYRYNAYGEVTSEVLPGQAASMSSMDAAGNVLSRMDGRGVIVSYTYDAINRLTSVRYPDPALRVDYVYDVTPTVCGTNERYSKGGLSRVIHPGGSTEYCRNDLGQVTRKVQTVDGVTLTLTYTYSMGGALTSMTYPDGTIVEYQRTQGRVGLVGLTRPGQGWRTLIGSIRHAPAGPILSWGYGSLGLDATFTRAYDKNYRVQELKGPYSGGLELAFEYDAVGSITKLKRNIGGSTLARYEYDGLGRLTHTIDGESDVSIEAYDYDATGNRRSVTTSAGTDVYQYLSGTHQLSSVGSELRSYDAAGNTVKIGSREFDHNDANRVGRVRRDGAVVESYQYNHIGERIRRSTPAGQVTSSVYDEDGRWLGDYNSAGKPLQQIVWLEEFPVAVISSPSPGVPEIGYIHPDHLGTPRVVVDSVRKVKIWEWSNLSEVFGNQSPNVDPDGDGIGFDLKLRFPGQQAADATGLFYNYQRDYDPVTGRYTQSDPIGLNGGISTYAYAEGRPLTRFDQFGLDSAMFYVGKLRMPPPDGKPAEDAVKAGKILSEVHAEMKSRRISGADQFYHCIAACKATQATGDPATVLELMALKEGKDYLAGRVGLYGKGGRISHADMIADNRKDLAVNRFGAACDMKEDCARRCAHFVPVNSRPYLQNYIPEWRRADD